ncbi:MAG: glycosyltransferase family 2 protein [Bacteroidetes bacterium]|nr:glycosyltransferase family 2 protein [Bacteroidota bacterium]
MNVHTDRPAVAVVILNWNGRHYLEKFFPSLFHSSYPNMRVYVADNGSTDDSLSFLENKYPQTVLLKSSYNRGFAGGYNWALSHIQEELIVVLNSDIEVDSKWIEPIVELFERHKDVAAIQPKILDLNRRSHFEYAGAAGGWIDRLGYPFSRGRIFDVLETDNGQYQSVSEIFWASGAAMFIRRSAFLKVGGFDEFFFAHHEEIDLCWRLQRWGYRILASPDSIVYHVGGGTLPKDNSRKVFLNFRNNLIMLSKNLPLGEACWVIPTRFALDAISAYKNLFSGQSGYFFAVMRSHFAFFGWLIAQKKQSVFSEAPRKTAGLKGLYKESVVWQHFVLGKNRFSEIVSSQNG